MSFFRLEFEFFWKSVLKNKACGNIDKKVVASTAFPLAWLHMLDEHYTFVKAVDNKVFIDQKHSFQTNWKCIYRRRMKL